MVVIDEQSRFLPRDARKPLLSPPLHVLCANSSARGADSTHSVGGGEQTQHLPSRTCTAASAEDHRPPAQAPLPPSSHAVRARAHTLSTSWSRGGACGVAHTWLQPSELSERAPCAPSCTLRPAAPPWRGWTSCWASLPGPRKLPLEFPVVVGTAPLCRPQTRIKKQRTCPSSHLGSRGCWDSVAQAAQRQRGDRCRRRRPCALGPRGKRRTRGRRLATASAKRCACLGRRTRSGGWHCPLSLGTSHTHAHRAGGQGRGAAARCRG